MSGAKKLFRSVASNTLAAVPAIEDFYAQTVYNGTGSSQNITTNVDLSGANKGLIWIKTRNTGGNHYLYDTERGVQKELFWNIATGENSSSSGEGITAFTSTGFTIGTGDASVNGSSNEHIAYTFKKKVKFFDIQTVTVLNNTAKTVDLSSLGNVGMIIARPKDHTLTGYWLIWHKDLTDGYQMNMTNNSGEFAASSGDPRITVSGTTMTIGATSNYAGTWIIYAWAHNYENNAIVRCGEYTGSGAANNSVSVGFEPQLLISKGYSTSSNNTKVVAVDSKRGFFEHGNSKRYFLSNSDGDGQFSSNEVAIHSDGFRLSSNAADTNTSGYKYIYLAIRKGPLSTTFTNTDIFAAVSPTTSGSITGFYQSNFVTDLMFYHHEIGVQSNLLMSTRQTGGNMTTGDPNTVPSDSHPLDSFSADQVFFDFENGAKDNSNGTNRFGTLFRSARGVFNICTFLNDGSTSYPHGLGVAPELVIFKSTSGPSGSGYVWGTSGSALGTDNHILFNEDTGLSTTSNHLAGQHTNTHIFVRKSDKAYGGANGQRYQALLFASKEGISKIGTVFHAANSSTNVDCGFSSAARFVIFKRTTGNSWFYCNSELGIVNGGNDVYKALNSKATAVSTNDIIDPISSGFVIKGSIGEGTYLFIAFR